ncbi:MAG: tRNA pseudouridine(13) synthase TruD [Candidatus Hydrothermarchaeales archaeon]
MKTRSPYPLDRFLGLEYFITTTPGIGGKLRTVTKDFVVEELHGDAVETPGDYTHFTLEKENWDGMGAVKAMARALKVSLKRFGFAGTKDKRAVTRQRVSVWRIEPEELQRLRIKGITLSDFVKSDRRISLGDSLGNRFEIIIRDVDMDPDKAREIIDETIEQLTERGIPNYFGYQRFGIRRPNTHLVGRELVKGDLEGAVMAYLGNPVEGESEDVQEARRFVQDTRDFKKALEIFPKRLGYERSMLDALSKNPRDYAGALRRLPKKIGRLLVHAYQGYLFNKVLSAMLEEDMEIRGIEIPLFGYKGEFSSGRQGELEKKIIDDEHTSMRRFHIKAMPELSSAGDQRNACISTNIGFQLSKEVTDKLKVVVGFELPKGSYATVVLRELMKSEPLSY